MLVWNNLGDKLLKLFLYAIANDVCLWDGPKLVWHLMAQRSALSSSLLLHKTHPKPHNSRGCGVGPCLGCALAAALGLGGTAHQNAIWESCLGRSSCCCPMPYFHALRSPILRCGWVTCRAFSSCCWAIAACSAVPLDERCCSWWCKMLSIWVMKNNHKKERWLLAPCKRCEVADAIFTNSQIASEVKGSLGMPAVTCRTGCSAGCNAWLKVLCVSTVPAQLLVLLSTPLPQSVASVPLISWEKAARLFWIGLWWDRATRLFHLIHQALELSLQVGNTRKLVDLVTWAMSFAEWRGY